MGGRVRQIRGILFHIGTLISTSYNCCAILKFTLYYFTVDMMSEGLFYSSVDEEDLAQRKRRLPTSVTTPRRGPLVLRVARQQPNTGYHSQLEPSGGYRKQSRNSLTRFPVVIEPRPLQLIEANLGHLSCATLQTAVHHTLVSPMGEGVT